MDIKYMNRCFELAVMGTGNVSPNPMVGAVIVHDGKIIGEGYHRQYGQAHAEVNAINSVKNQELLKNSTIYVSLEPCSHYGKTPPCAELLIQKQLKKCVIANLDPNEKVAGNGIKMLKSAGIEVTYGIQANKGRYINRRFFCFHEKKRPYIILKIAQSSDGYIDLNTSNNSFDRQPYWITSDAAKIFSHCLRKENDAILVGANTVKNDNCQLNLRYLNGRSPIRIVYDRDLSLPLKYNFFDDSQKTLIFNNISNNYKNTQYQFRNTSFIKIEDTDKIYEEIIRYIYNIGINSLLVEGGAKTINKFLKLNLWDEIILITGAKKFYKGIKTPAVDISLKASTSEISSDRIDIFYNKNAF